MKTRVDRFVDTNVLLTATASARQGHAAALSFLQAGFAERSLFLDRANFLREDEAVRDALLHLLDVTACSGKQVHDANIAATMLAHGIGVLVTLNPRDFERFTPAVQVVGLEQGTG